MTMIIHKKHDAGFTLIELLVAISLLSVIMVLLFNSLFTISRSWNIGQTKVTENNDFRLVSQFLKRHISQAKAVKWKNNKKQDLLFIGTAKELTFASNLPAHRGGGGLSVIKLSVSNEENKPLLIQYQYADPIEINKILATKPRNESVLIENVDQFTLSYFGRKKKNDDPRWHTYWDDAQLMPDVVGLKLTSHDEKKQWPEMLISIHTHAQTSFPEFTIQSSKDRGGS